MRDFTPKLQKALAERARTYEAVLLSEPTTGFAAVFERHGKRRVTMGADTGLNASAAVRLCRDKFFTEQFLAMAGLAVPGSTLLEPRSARAFDLPCVIKPNDGMAGEGVSLVRNAASVDAALEKAFARSPLALCQPLLVGREFRVVVLDQSVLYAYQRLSGEHGISNLSQGGQVVWPENLSEALLATAIRAVEVCGLRYGGVDVFCVEESGHHRDVVLEVNPSPGFAGLSTRPALSEHVFDQIADAFFDM